MKELKNLDAIRELLASHSFYTYDYTDGIHINEDNSNSIYSIDLDNDPHCCLLGQPKQMFNPQLN